LTRVLTKGSVARGIFEFRGQGARVLFDQDGDGLRVRQLALHSDRHDGAVFGDVRSGDSIALLGVDPLPPSAFTVSATLFVSNAALFHSCASASPA